jgi:hypothetical protein
VTALTDNADMEAQDIHGETTLFVDARYWNRRTLRFLVHWRDENFKDEFGNVDV